MKKVEATAAEKLPHATPSQEPNEKSACEIKIDTANPATQVQSKQKKSTSDIECLTYRDPFSFVYKK